ncbi:MAG TPA: ATP-binding protein [Candidatus Paceibacterota bacterium]|nr:ATP-binding protein [Candidatus Paceibacterota bacterium]
MNVGLSNFDLLSVGITVAATVILGFVVFFNDWKSGTNRWFLAFSLVTAAWGIINYVSYQAHDPVTIIKLLRLELFFAVFQAFSLFRLFLVFPLVRVSTSALQRWLIVPLVLVTAGVTAFTHYVLWGVEVLNPNGGAISVQNGPAIALFGLVSVGLVVSAVFILYRKMHRATGLERRQMSWIWVGTLTTFLLIIIFNFVSPAFLNNPRFVPLGSVFFFPFIAFTFFAIVRYHLLNVKVIATEILAFSLTLVALVEIVIAQSVGVIIFRAGVFALTLSFSILLIRSVLKEVEQREQLEELAKQLEAATGRLEELSRFKTQLLSLASHQIRAPLAAIKGYATLLLDGSFGSLGALQVGETIEKIKRSSDDLIALINTLLDLRKVEEGKMDYQFAKTNFTKLVGDMMESLRSLADNKKITLELKKPEKDIFVTADEQKLRQVIQNLVDNAIKYTPQGSVVIEVKEAAGGLVQCSVTDSGVGFEPEMANHLFEEFVRDERIKKQILGTGLGLFIARKIMEAHGGKIWAESKGAGQGSTFSLSLKKL